MSTATWTIDHEDAELISSPRDESMYWNLNRAWPSNWLIGNANQYEWAAFDEEGIIICWRCAVKNVLDGIWEKVELFTYEDTEEVLCDQCDAIWLGGFAVDCECCERTVWSVPVITTATRLWGSEITYSEGGGAELLNDDGSVNYDDRMYDCGDGGGGWVCCDCLEAHYDYDINENKYIKKGN